MKKLKRDISAEIPGHAKLCSYGSPSDVYRTMKYAEHLGPPVDCQSL